MINYQKHVEISRNLDVKNSQGKADYENVRRKVTYQGLHRVIFTDEGIMCWTTFQCTRTIVITEGTSVSLRMGEVLVVQ